MKIILASKSPRRTEILNTHGIQPVLMPTDTDESLPDEIGMTEAAPLLAERKARACYESIKDCIEYSDYIIIGADTIVWKDELMGKPESRDDAFRMLDKIRGTVHYVVTGVSIINVSTGTSEILSEITEVHCKNYSDDDINEYLDTDEPYDKAGAYAIQGYFGRYIDYFVGDYENVVGLPYNLIEPYIKEYK